MKNKLIKSKLIFAAWAIPVLLLAWFAYTLIQNTKTQPQEKNQEIQITVNFNNKPVEGTETVETTRKVPVTCPFSGETKTSEVKTVVKTTKAEPSERRVVITEDAFKETMQQVAYTARQEAQNEYDKNFVTLLTILTIFGIAWPVIIALLQFKFNENELNKIKQAQDDAQKALNDNQELQNKVEKIVQEFYIRNDFLWQSMAIIFESQANSFLAIPNPDKSVVNNYRLMSLVVITWRFKLANGMIPLKEEDTTNIINKLSQITPEEIETPVTKHNLNNLRIFRDWLCQNIICNDPEFQKNLDLIKMTVFEKIVAYEKLLATSNNNTQQ